MSDYLTDEEVRERYKAFSATYPGASWGLYSALAERGHSDDAILAMGPDEMFDEFCEWHGLIRWGPTLRTIMENAMDMPDKDEEVPVG